MEESKNNSTLKKVIVIIATIILIAIIAILCAGYVKKATTKVQNPIVTMEVENYGTIKIEFLLS